MKASPVNIEWEEKKMAAKTLIAAGGALAIKFWSHTDALRLAPEQYKKEIGTCPLEMPYISEWEAAAKRAIELINQGLALIKPKSADSDMDTPEPDIKPMTETDLQMVRAFRQANQSSTEPTIGELLAIRESYLNFPANSCYSYSAKIDEIIATRLGIPRNDS